MITINIFIFNVFSEYIHFGQDDVSHSFLIQLILLTCGKDLIKFSIYLTRIADSQWLRADSQLLQADSQWLRADSQWLRADNQLLRADSQLLQADSQWLRAENQWLRAFLQKTPS